MLVKATEFKIVLADALKFPKDPSFISTLIKGKPTELSLRRAFRNIFIKAKREKKTKVVFPAVGIKEDLPAGNVAGFPLIAVAKILAQEILRFCRAYPGAIKTMVLAVEDKQTLLLFESQVYGYIRHVQDDLSCGPYSTVDIIIHYKGGLVVIERTNPPFGFALPGGFVDNGESLEHAAVRETKEETNLELKNLKQFHTYSDPCRDPRFQTIATVFVAQGKGTLRSGDDAKGAQIIPADKILKYNFAFDHKEIIRDYLKACGQINASL